MSWLIDARDLLHAVQMGHVYSDSKTFVDMVPRVPCSNLREWFAERHRPKNVLTAFVRDNFAPAGSDVVEALPPDWTPEPDGFLPNVDQQDIRGWALEVHGLWRTLCRQVSPQADPLAHTLLPLPNPFLIPGDRFREMYYWDSYWVVRGLLVSKMPGTAQGLVENLLHLVEQHGFAPNGARTYYLNRSQPPLLSAMVAQVWGATRDARFLRRALSVLLIEAEHWASGNKHVLVVDGQGRTHALTRYYANLDSPRPESYWEDADLAAGLEAAAQQLHTDLASAAESGWDFSSRWFADGQSLATIRTTQVVPADLNAFLFDMERNIAVFARELNEPDTAAGFARRAAARLAAVHAMLWDGATDQWRDLIIDAQDSSGLITASHLNKDTYASNWVPLWCGCTADAMCSPHGMPPDTTDGSSAGTMATMREPHTFSQPDKSQPSAHEQQAEQSSQPQHASGQQAYASGSSQAKRSIRSLQASGLVLPGGIATSLRDTGQQWDFPNAWPPLQHMLIEACARNGGESSTAFAASLAWRWLASNLSAYRDTGKMLEKYDARRVGGAGGGGEYELQTGFGWTNGVMLALLDVYGFDGKTGADSDSKR